MNNNIINQFAHELRNPLTSAYSTIQLIERSHPEVREYKFWNALAGDFEYMNDLITKFTHFAQYERLKLEAFSTKAMLEQVSLSFAASIASSKVEYTSKLDPSLPIIYGDEVTLKEVIRNLLKNAFEACQPDKTIYLEAFSKNSNLIIQVKDTGCGIPKEYMPTLFNPFITHKKDGTGLGLAICNQIVKSHNGTLEVESTPGVGTTFTVSIPWGNK